MITQSNIMRREITDREYTLIEGNRKIKLNYWSARGDVGVGTRRESYEKVVEVRDM